MRALFAALSVVFLATPVLAQEQDVPQAQRPAYVPNSFDERFRSEGIRLDADLPLFASDEGLVYRSRNFEVSFGPVELPGRFIARGHHVEDDVFLVRIRFGIVPPS